jgi:hypothetical protein
VSRSFPQSPGARTASSLQKVDRIQRSFVFEDAVLPPRTILLAEPEAGLRATWRSTLDGMGFGVREEGPVAAQTAKLAR